MCSKTLFLDLIISTIDVEVMCWKVVLRLSICLSSICATSSTSRVHGILTSFGMCGLRLEDILDRVCRACGSVHRY